MRKWMAILVTACALSGAQAAVKCQNYNDRETAPDDVYVLAFVGEPGGDAARAHAVMANLEDRLSLALRERVRKLAARVSDTPPNVVVFACDSSVRESDFARADAESLWNGNVVAVLWGGTEAGKPVVLHLSVPQYHRRPDASRNQLEIAWLHASGNPQSLEDWSAELERENPFQQGLLAMGVGLISMKHAQWPLAKRSLCQARANLKVVARDTVRPGPGELEHRLAPLVNQALAEVENEAARRGVNLNSDPLRLACTP